MEKAIKKSRSAHGGDIIPGDARGFPGTSLHRSALLCAIDESADEAFAVFPEFSMILTPTNHKLLSPPSKFTPKIVPLPLPKRGVRSIGMLPSSQNMKITVLPRWVHSQRNIHTGGPKVASSEAAPKLRPRTTALQERWFVCTKRVCRIL